MCDSTKYVNWPNRASLKALYQLRCELPADHEGKHLADYVFDEVSVRTQWA